MKNKKDLKYYLSLDYDNIVHKRKNKFVIYIDELCIVEEDENLQNAFEKVEQEKEAFFKKMIEEGYQDYIREPYAVKNEEKPYFSIQSLIPFFIKLSVIFFILLIALFPITKMLNPNYVISLTKGGASTVINKINSMPEKNREALIQTLRETIRNTKPFIDEFKVLLDEKDGGKVEKSNLNRQIEDKSTKD